MKKYVFESLKFFCAAILCTILTAFATPSWAACNLWDMSSLRTQTLKGLTFTPNADGTISVTGTAEGYAAYALPLFSVPSSLIGQQITISALGDSTNVAWTGITLLDANNTEISTIQAAQSTSVPYVTITITDPATKYISAGIKRKTDGVAVSTVVKPMIERGDTATAYTPYNPLCATCNGTVVNYVSATGTGVQNGTPTPTNPIEPTFYKQGNMVLRKVGDYADSYDASTGKITRRVGVKVLDGTENWQKSSNYTGGVYLNPRETYWVTNSAILCTHFEGMSDTNHYARGKMLINNGYLSFWYGTNADTSVDDTKTFLASQYAAGTPVTVWYPLAEETTEDWPASYCETPIKIATTKYNETAFSPLNTALQNAISVVDTVVSNTITQAASIATLQAQKQTRPNDIADDNEKCPAYKQCLLVEDENGTPHWYEITDPFRDFVAPIIANNVNGSSRDSSPGVPSAYTQLEYIESTGTQYIDTGIIAKQPFDTRLGVSFADNNKRYLFGISNNSPGYCGRRDNGRFEMNNIFTSMLGKKDEKYELHYYATSNGTVFEIKGPDNETETLEVVNIASAADSTISWKIMNNMDAYTLNGNIYYAQISQSGTLLFNGIPVRRNSDGAIGMYDTVSGEFFENKGTGSFIAGPVVPNSPSSWSVSWAADANKGISAGTVNGTSACNSISGAALEIATDTQTSSANWNAGGVDCWCQVTGVENDGEYTSIETSWIFDSVRSSALNCDTTCARSCSGSVMNTATYRNKLFGV